MKFDLNLEPERGNFIFIKKKNQLKLHQKVEEN